MQFQKSKRPIVLIVEDDPFVRRRVVRLFHSETSLGVIEADGISRAAEWIEDKHAHFDAILCDLTFTKDKQDPNRNLGDGIDLIKYAVCLRPTVRSYVLSVTADDNWERKRAKQLNLNISGWYPKLAPSPSETFWSQIEADLLLPSEGEMPTTITSTQESSNVSARPFEFDVFLAHNNKDKSDAERLGKKLKQLGLNPWLDKWNLPPGRLFQDEIEKIIPKIRSIAILCGKSGIGPWETLEIRLAITQFVRRNAPVIPVLLPGANPMIELPLLLHEFSWLRFRRSITEKDSLDLLVWGITGSKPIH
jgi:CheY-like chemotaxis protein